MVEPASDNGGNSKNSMGKIMLEVGYSHAYAKNPQKLKNTKGWKDLITLAVPEDEVVLSHGELLHAFRLQHYIFSISESDEIIKAIINSLPGCRLVKINKLQQHKKAYYHAPDNRIRKDAIDMAYKLRGRYIKEQERQEDPYDSMSDEELEKREKELEEKVKSRYDKAIAEKRAKANDAALSNVATSV